jgi:hypothetical protein
LLRRIQTSSTSHRATNCSITASPKQAAFLFSMKSFVFSAGSVDSPEDAMQRKQAWMLAPELFKDQLKFLGGKPGVVCLERHEEAVARDFDNLMKATNKKTPTDCTMDDNATLIRCRVMCFNRTKLRKREKSPKVAGQTNVEDNQ